MGILGRLQTPGGTFGQAVDKMHNHGHRGYEPNARKRGEARDEALELLKSWPLSAVRERVSALHASEEMRAPGHDHGRKDRQSRAMHELDVLTAVAVKIEDTPHPQHDAFARALTQAPNNEVGALAEMSGAGLSRRAASARVIRFWGLEHFHGGYAKATRQLRDQKRAMQPAKDAILRKARLTPDDHASLRDIDADLKPYEDAVYSWTHSMSEQYQGTPLSTAELADNGELQAS